MLQKGRKDGTFVVRKEPWCLMSTETIQLIRDGLCYVVLAVLVVRNVNLGSLSFPMTTTKLHMWQAVEWLSSSVQEQCDFSFFLSFHISYIIIRLILQLSR